MLETESTEFLNVIKVKVKKETYLLEVRDVKEIYVPGDNVIPIPLSREDIVGIIDIRGEIYTIISLRRKIYNKNIPIDLESDSRIILLEKENLNIALLVDSVIGVQKIPMSMFDAKKTIVETKISYKYIKGLGVLDDETYILLDLDALLPEIDLSQIERKHVPIKRNAKSQGKKREIREPKEKKKRPAKYTNIPAPSKKTKPQPVVNRRLNLTEEQKDTLREIGNIGSGNAITALSQLIKKKIDVDLTDVGIVAYNNLSSQFGNPQEKVCGIFSHIKEPSQSTILQVFELNPLMKVVANLAGKDSQLDPNEINKKSDLDDFALSTVEEMGNIMAGHYASALADLTGAKMVIDKPEFAMNEARKLGKFLGQELESISEFLVLIKTSIRIKDLELNGVFFFIPDINTVKNMFNNLGIQYTPEEISSEELEEEKITMDNLELDETQRDALQEVGNIGAGNAANALAKMINKRVDMNIPDVKLVELDDYARDISTKEKRLFVSWSNVKGKTKATVLTIFKVKDIIELTSILIDDPKKKKIDMRKSYKRPDDFPEIYEDAMKELGHILGSNYTSAIGDLLNIRLLTDPPDMSIDTGEKLFEILTDEIGLLKKLSLVITTSILIRDFKITGTFLFIPEIQTLKNLLDVLKNFY
ncbi:MAG: chemotaxis protein CheC [archaeon]